jgi:hypothetical protein
MIEFLAGFGAGILLTIGFLAALPTGRRGGAGTGANER